MNYYRNPKKLVTIINVRNTMKLHNYIRLNTIYENIQPYNVILNDEFSYFHIFNIIGSSLYNVRNSFKANASFILFFFALINIYRNFYYFLHVCIFFTLL